MTKRWPLILILVIAVGTPLLATALFFFAPPTGTTNRGELLEPLPLPDGIVLPAVGTEEIWHLLAIGPAACDLACQQRLCLVHQIRLVHLGEKDRIGRIWLIEGATATPTELTMEPGCGRDLPAAHATLDPIDILGGVNSVRLPAGWLQQLPAPAAGSARDAYLYIVDPQARVIMRYPAQTPASHIAKDLGRLLRLSQRA